MLNICKINADLIFWESNKWIILIITVSSINCNKLKTIKIKDIINNGVNLINITKTVKKA